MMNFLKIKTNWSNTELGLVKIYLVSAGIVIALEFHEFLIKYILLFFIVYILTTIGSVFLWVKKMKK